MSVMVPVRLSEELVAKMDERGSRTEVIKAALEMYFAPKMETQPAGTDQTQKPTDSQSEYIKRERGKVILTDGLTAFEHDASECRLYGCLLCEDQKRAKSRP